MDAFVTSNRSIQWVFDESEVDCIIDCHGQIGKAIVDGCPGTVVRSHTPTEITVPGSIGTGGRYALYRSNPLLGRQQPQIYD